MNNKNDIFSKYNEKKSSTPYNVPQDYFKHLNDEIVEKVFLSTKKKTPIISLNIFYRYAAAIVLIAGSYLMFNLQTNSTSIDYYQLSDSIDDYLSNDDVVYYTFIDDIESSDYLNVDENLSDYLEFEF